MKILERSLAPLLVSDKPQEEFTIGYCSVLLRQGIWQMWYSAYDADYRYDCDACLCYAESRDGEHWKKPDLGLHEFRGSRQNNIVFDGRAHQANITTVFRDDRASPEERFKGLAQKFFGRDQKGKGIWQCFGAVSPDGLSWRLYPQSHYPWNADTQNVCFWDRGAYRYYLRLWKYKGADGSPVVSTETQKAGKRIIGLSESPSFTSFPRAEEILAPDEEDPDDLDFYTNACTKIRDDLYIMFISAYYRKEDVVRVQAAFSGDGRSFRRHGRNPVLDLGSGFDSKCIYVAPGAVPGHRPQTYWFYYLGTSTKHNENYPDKGRHLGGIGRFLLDLSWSGPVN